MNKEKKPEQSNFIWLVAHEAICVFLLLRVGGFTQIADGKTILITAAIGFAGAVFGIILMRKTENLGTVQRSAILFLLFVVGLFIK